jgi:hypothetical protein
MFRKRTLEVHKMFTATSSGWVLMQIPLVVCICMRALWKTVKQHILDSAVISIDTVIQPVTPEPPR